MADIYWGRGIWKIASNFCCLLIYTISFHVMNSNTRHGVHGRVKLQWSITVTQHHKSSTLQLYNFIEGQLRLDCCTGWTGLLLHYFIKVMVTLLAPLLLIKRLSFGSIITKKWQKRQTWGYTPTPRGTNR